MKTLTKWVLCFAGLTLFSGTLFAKKCAPESPSLLNFACENDETWTIGIGAGIGYGSVADASPKKEFGVEPAIIAHVSNDWGQITFNGQELGGRIFANENINFGLVARLEPGRSEKEDPDLLKGQGDTPDKLMARPEVRVNLLGNWNVWIGGTSLLGDRELGNLHIASLGLGINKIGILDLELLVSQRWATNAFINKDFGVNAEQSSRNGLPLYSAGSGTQSTAIALIGKIDWTKKIKTVFEIGYDQYASRLRNSPIIQRGIDHEFEMGATFLYLF